MRTFLWWASVVALSVVLMNLASARAEDAGDDVNLSFGVYQTDKPSTMYQQFTPVIKQIERNMGERLGRPVRIHMVIFKTYEEANQALVDGEVDFVRFGPASYVLAKDRNPDISLLAMEHEKGKKRFHGVIVVPEHSPVQKLADLKGSRFAFGDENSTIGRYLVQDVLAKAGVHARDLAGYAYLDRHDTVAKAVALGDYDAGSVKENTFKKLNQDGKLRVLHRFENVMKPWIARSGLDPKLLSPLRESLLAIKDPAALKALKFSGFLPAEDADYQFVRDGMKRSEKFFQ
ncbi:MAG: PhnD/SsuA/transferrin family substrate-binding protein [Pirellulales bacterium]|nr:PhnD/SsuA/transferrin family substrate-binding protein [Pirellulales bacterium]